MIAPFIFNLTIFIVQSLTVICILFGLFGLCCCKGGNQEDDKRQIFELRSNSPSKSQPRDSYGNPGL
jgi:hypothetical protein